MARPTKLSGDEVLSQIKKALSLSRVVLTDHANQRMKERRISWFEVKEVLLRGHNERRKDQFKKEFQCWTYSIRYDLVVSESEKRRLRIPVALDSDGTVIVSAIDIDQDESI